MTRRLLLTATNVACALALLLLPLTAWAEPLFRVELADFTDSDSDGQIDCGETIRFRVSVAETLPSSNVSGSLVIPSPPAQVQGWHFQPGSVAIDNTFTVRCSPVIVHGNSPGHDYAQVDYSCSTSSPPNGGYVTAFYVSGTYLGFFASTAVVVPASHQQGSLVQRVEGLAEGAESCFAPDVALTKNDGGLTAGPGSLVSYTLGLRNLGSLSATSVTLTDVVPAHSTFDAAASSPGWSCSPGPAAGSVCSFLEGTLAVGASVSRTFAVRVDTPAGTSLLSNTATVTTTGRDSDLANNTASDTTPVDPGSPDLVQTKTLSSGSGNPGSVNVYTLTVRNAGVAPAAAVEISETIPPFTRFDAAASAAGWSCAPSGNPGSTCTFAVGALAPGASRSAAFGLRIDATLPASASSVTNTACSSTTSSGDPAPNNCASTTTPLGGSPSLSLAKTLASGTATPGATLTWNLTLQNTGNREAAAPVLRETVPAHTVFSAASSSPGWACSPGPAAGSTCTLTLSALAAGAQASRSFAVTIDNPLPAGVSAIANTACGSDPKASEVCDTIRHPTDAAPSLVMTKSLQSGTGEPGTVLVYRLTVANAGNQAASAVTLTETVPDHTTFAAAGSSPGWNCVPTSGAGSTCTLAVGALAGGGASVSRDFAVLIAKPLPAGVSLIANTACAGASAVSSDCDDEVTPTLGAPVLGIAKRLLTENPGPGTLLTYEITVTNSGNQDAAAVAVSDPLPPATTFDAGASSPGWACAPSNEAPSTCTLSLSSLAAGASATLRLAARLRAPLPADLEVLTNTACAELGAQRSCSSTSTPLGGSPLLQIQKTYTGGPLAPGALLTFHLEVTNAGDQDATGLTVTETVPQYSTFAAASSTAGWVCSGTDFASTCTFAISSLGVGEIRDLVFAVRAAAPLPEGVAQIANAACLVGPEGSTCDDVSTPLPVAVELFLSDTLATDADANGTAGPGDTLRYSLSLTNPSAAAAADLTLTVEIDPHANLVPGSVLTDLGDVTVGNGPTDTTVVLTIPRLEAGASATALFRAVIGAVPAGLDHLSTQARAAGSNFADELSDDPETPEDDDPTLTPLGVSLTPVQEIPTLDTIGLGLLFAALALFGLRFLRTA